MSRTVLLVLMLAAPTGAADRRWSARELFHSATTENIEFVGDHFELADGELIEDDGPAAGYSYLPNEEKLSDTVRARKVLQLTDPRTDRATLLVGSRDALSITVNGRKLDTKSEKVGDYWQAFPVPSDCLKKGDNTVDLAGPGKIWIARSEEYATGSRDRSTHPGRSSRSSDGGTTWVADRLGPTGTIRGEYYVRLFLHRYQSDGTLTLPVIDVGNLTGKPIGPPIESVGPVTVVLEADAAASGRISVRVRTGTDPTPDAKNWSEWQRLPAPGRLDAPRGRYLQVAVRLETDDPRQSPRLQALIVRASPTIKPDWTERLRVATVGNEPVVHTTIPFIYEPFDHPRLNTLRDQYRLDTIVSGAKDDWEMATRLAVWASNRWEKGHLKEGYPAWDALDILRPHSDGTPVGGFCQQYNLVFLQACESFGIPGRPVSIGVGDHRAAIRGGGHEVIEIWSNRYRKWVYLDGNCAWYAVDEASDTPLSLLELRARQLNAIHGKPFAPIRIVHLKSEGRRWESLTSWPPFLELRMIPRSNFLESPTPRPLNQGMRGWFWTGHHVWTDDACPASFLYGHRVSNPRNWNWTLNHAHATLEATPTPGELRVHLDTETPGFAGYRTSIDDGEASLVQPTFAWKLNRGVNRLTVVPRNIAGRDGSQATIAVTSR